MSNYYYGHPNVSCIKYKGERWRTVFSTLSDVVIEILEDGTSPRTVVISSNDPLYLVGTTYPNGYWLWDAFAPIFEDEKVEATTFKCTCDFNTLMTVGCKCGAFKREQELKKGA